MPPKKKKGANAHPDQQVRNALEALQLPPRHERYRSCGTGLIKALKREDFEREPTLDDIRGFLELVKDLYHVYRCIAPALEDPEWINRDLKTAAARKRRKDNLEDIRRELDARMTVKLNYWTTRFRRAENAAVPGEEEEAAEEEEEAEEKVPIKPKAPSKAKPAIKAETAPKKKTPIKSKAPPKSASDPKSKPSPQPKAGSKRKAASTSTTLQVPQQPASVRRSPRDHKRAGAVPNDQEEEEEVEQPARKKRKQK